MKSKSSKIMVSRGSKIFQIFIYYLLNKLTESNKDFRDDAWALYFYNVLSS